MKTIKNKVCIMLSRTFKRVIVYIAVVFIFTLVVSYLFKTLISLLA